MTSIHSEVPSPAPERPVTGPDSGRVPVATTIVLLTLVAGLLVYIAIV